MKRTSLTSRSIWIFSLLLVIALMLAACQPAEAPAQPTLLPTAEPTMAPTEAPTEAMEPTEAAAPAAVEEEPTVTVAEHPELGQILVDAEGMTLYMFTKDEANKSNCSGGCLAAWPPLLTNGSPVAGDGVDESLLGAGDLGDGRQIVTYNGMPLYYWQNDTKPGDATGQDVNQVWYVVNPAGEIVREAIPATGNEGSVPSNEEATVTVYDHPEFGEILADNKGMVLYMFTKDEPDKSNCSGGCLAAWPPLLVEGDPVAGEGVDQAMLGTADMPDGTKIVTYNSMPLYYWASDVNPGDATGQDVNQVWYVVNPAGEVVKEPVSSGESSAPAGEATVTVFEHPEFGPILADSKGMVLYMFTKDEPNKVNCSGGCLAAWPPLLVEGDPVAGEGVDQSLLGTTDMPDGTKIVTYNEMPLYYWASDMNPGDATGQDVNKVWYVVNPEGEPVGMQ